MQAGGPGGLITNGSGSFRGRIDGQPGPMGGAGSMGGSGGAVGSGGFSPSYFGVTPGQVGTVAGSLFGPVAGLGARALSSYLNNRDPTNVYGRNAINGSDAGFSMGPAPSPYNPLSSIYSSGSNRGSYSTSGSSTNSDGSSNGGSTGTRGGY